MTDAPKRLHMTSPNGHSRDCECPDCDKYGAPWRRGKLAGDARATDAVETVARAICLTHGQDPDDEAPLSDVCDANNGPVEWWKYYEEDAQAAIAAMPPSVPVTPELAALLSVATAPQLVIGATSGRLTPLEKAAVAYARSVKP